MKPRGGWLDLKVRVLRGICYTQRASRGGMGKGQGPVCIRKYQSLLRPSAEMSCKLTQNLASWHRAERLKDMEISLEKRKEGRQNWCTAFSEVC